MQPHPTPSDPSAALSDALGPRDDARAALATLDPATRAELGRLVVAAREHQRSATRKAIDEALVHVPALLRGAVKKLLFPS